MRKRRVWIWVGVITAAVLVALVVAGIVLSRRFQPYIQAQTVAYLEERFDSKVQLERLTVSMPVGSPLRVLLSGGRGAKVRVEARNLAVRYRGRTDIPPMLRIQILRFDVDLPTLWSPPAHVLDVRLDGLELTLPPKGERPAIQGRPAGKIPRVSGDEIGTPVVIDRIVADGARLTILPRDSSKQPLTFDIMKLKLRGAAADQPMHFDAVLTNAKPPGLIESAGMFGPWATSAPSESPISGSYTFKKANLGVFKGIGGTLASAGAYQGVLDRVVVDGTADVPDFRLSGVGNAVPLSTKFHAIVDGTNGNTLLQPVIARLGSTIFRCEGGVVRAKQETGKTVSLDVVMEEGRIDDVLKLAMKGGKPFLRGGVGLRMKFALPPGKGEISDRLIVSGDFDLRNARFTSPMVQQKIDDFSRMGQGRPKDESIGEVASNLAGKFAISNGIIRFSSLQFNIPGSEVNLHGRFRFQDESLAFRGKVRLDARISQTQTGWKRVVLKPVDPFFAKEGAGTQLAIQITGTRNAPQFGRDQGVAVD